MRPLLPSIHMMSLACLLGLAWTGLARSGIGDRIRQSAIAPVEFKIRSAALQAPELHSTIKIFGFDDKTRMEFGPQETLPISQWQKILTALASRKPKAILVDKVFSDPIGTEADFAAFRDALSSAATPVYVAAINHQLSLHSAAADMIKSRTWRIDRPVAPVWVEKNEIFAADDRIADAFSGFATIQRSDSAYLKPALILGRSSSEVLPSLGLSLGENAYYGADKLNLDNTSFSLDPKGRIPVNFMDPSETLKKIWPLREILKNSENASSIQYISPGDIVFVLPSLYSGGTDFKDSPVGHIPGAFYQVALLNSLLTGKTLTSLGQSWPISLALHVLIALTVMWTSLRLRFRTALSALAAASLVMVLVPLFLFVNAGIISDWPTYFATVVSATVAFGTHRIFQHQRWSDRIDFALTGLVEPKILKILKHTPDLLHRQAR
ncbi:MAG: hypothetical protein RIR26_1353, partial [Pseudomonadota bacterium]